MFLLGWLRFCGFFLPTTNSVIKQERPCPCHAYIVIIVKNVPAAICDSLVLLVGEVSEGPGCDRRVAKDGESVRIRAAATASLALDEGHHQLDHADRFASPSGTFAAGLP